MELKQFREEDFQAAVKDGKTGRIYTGYNHGEAIDKGVKEGGSFAGKSDHGFLMSDDKFITRAEAKELFGFSTSEELHGLKNPFC
jgi:hypothetical protein